jgi:tyrosine-protein kinase Etk/Wzc
VFLSKRTRKNLLDDLALDAPCVTETRRLLQNLYRQQRSGESAIQCYLVTSATRGEGKSTISALMSIVSARIFNKRTLVVDGDLHRPSLHSLLGVSRGPGLFEIMRGTAAIREVTRSTSVPLLSAIASGYPREALGEWYSDEAFDRVLQELRPNYDVIFVDAPPTVPAIEPILMAEHVDALLIVALAGRTPLTMVRRTMQILTPVAAKIAGIVLNNAVDGLPYYFNYRYYGYETKPLRIRRPDTPRQTGESSAPKRAKNVGGGI